MRRRAGLCSKRRTSASKHPRPATRTSKPRNTARCSCRRGSTPSARFLAQTRRCRAWSLVSRSASSASASSRAADGRNTTTFCSRTTPRRASSFCKSRSSGKSGRRRRLETRKATLPRPPPRTRALGRRRFRALQRTKTKSTSTTCRCKSSQLCSLRQVALYGFYMRGALDPFSHEHIRYAYNLLARAHMCEYCGMHVRAD
mmetsp:Transcript_7391/g.20850  ORF Transcript_7391/g.20850 Transcript_7391/m.20850 type:complete len:201 (-) Transcript_7391:42-644(-)